MATIHTIVCDPLGIANMVPKESRGRLIGMTTGPGLIVYEMLPTLEHSRQNYQIWFLM